MFPRGASGKAAKFLYQRAPGSDCLWSCGCSPVRICSPKSLQLSCHYSDGNEPQAQAGTAQLCFHVAKPVCISLTCSSEHLNRYKGQWGVGHQVEISLRHVGFLWGPGAQVRV